MLYPYFGTPLILNGVLDLRNISNEEYFQKEVSSWILNKISIYQIDKKTAY